MPDAAAGGRTALRGTVAGIVLIAVLGAALLIILSGSGGGRERLTAPAPPEVPLPEETASPLSTEVPDEPPVLGPEIEDREPTDADAASFSAEYDPPSGGGVELVTADLDGDGRSEVVAAFVGEGYARVEVAVWEGRTYEVAFAGQGGPAAELLALEVRDVTGDGQREILTTQRTEERESLALWGVTEDGIGRLSVRGGCWDGSHVVGHDGAEVEDGQLIATCPPEEDADGRLARGGRDVYTWDGEAWTHDPTEDA